MTFRRAVAVASVLVIAGVSPSAAQFPPPPGQAASASQASPFPPPAGPGSPFPPVPGQASAPSGVFPPPPGATRPLPPAVSGAPPPQASPFPAPGQQPQGGRHACDAFLPLRQDAERGANAIRVAGERKASREEVCPLFRNFAAAESKMLRFLEKNQSLCGVPADAIKQAKSNHARTVQIRNQVCSAGPAPRGPSLSDALGGPLISNDPPRAGRGTFDTLTGPLQR